VINEDRDMPTHPLVRIVAGTTLLFGLIGTAFAQSDGNMQSMANTADDTFMKHAAADGMAEVQMGQMAMKKSSDADVKQLAQRIVDDHTKINDALRALAESKQVPLPTSLSADAQKQAAEVKKLDGKKFDQAWAKAMVKDHQKAVETFTTASKQAQDADTQKFATDTLPALNTHLQMAQKVQSHLTLSQTRDKAMGGMGSLDNNAFTHAHPAAAATSTTTPVPAPATAPPHSVGSHRGT
jgi:putative membrane protein